jgi:hypothetical protein
MEQLFFCFCQEDVGHLNFLLAVKNIGGDHCAKYGEQVGEDQSSNFPSAEAVSIAPSLSS